MSLHVAAFSSFNQNFYMSGCKYAVAYILSLMSEGVMWPAGTFVNNIYIFYYLNDFAVPLAVIFTCLAPEPAYNNSWCP